MRITGWFFSTTVLKAFHHEGHEGHEDFFCAFLHVLHALHGENPYLNSIG
jgi:hypothetical protein